MKRILIIASSLTCLALSGCNDVNGTLTVPAGSTLQLTDKKGQTFTVNTGDSNATVQMKTGKVILKTTTSTGKSDSIELDAPQGQQIPDYETTGEHPFLAKDSGQSVDIKEVTNDSVSNSNEFYGWENCTASQEVEVPCPPPVPQPGRPGGAGPGAGPGPNPVQGAPGVGGRPPGIGKPGKQASVKGTKKSRALADLGCRAVRVFNGRQQIQFHFSGDTFEIQLLMTDPKTNAPVGTFVGYTTTSDRIVDRTFGGCLIE
jgi:hypothetical protein